MATTDQAKEAAKLLYAAHQSHQVFESLPDTLAPRSIEDAYAVQDQLLRLLSANWGSLAGYKLAYTTPTMQERAKLTEPCAGGLLANTVMRSPAVLDSSRYVKLGVECEVGVELEADLPPEDAPYTRDKIAERVRAVMPAFEVVDIRTPDLQGQARALTAISTNISNAGVVLGPPVTNWRDLDLVSARGTLEINGVLLGEGHGSDIMGHPLEPLVWLANRLSQQGVTIPSGFVIITGSIVPPKPLNPGDTSQVWVEGLGSAHLSVT